MLAAHQEHTKEEQKQTKEIQRLYAEIDRLRQENLTINTRSAALNAEMPKEELDYYFRQLKKEHYSKYP